METVSELVLGWDGLAVPQTGHTLFRPFLVEYDAFPGPVFNRLRD